MTDQEHCASRGSLARELGLLALVATSLCTVIGGGINNLTVEIQESAAGVGPYVPLAFVLGSVPALCTALCYAVLATAMPRAGGGYIYVSRAVHPFVGFIATFSKWFGLAAAVGVIAYMDVPLLQAGCKYLGDSLGVQTAIGGAFAGLSAILRDPMARLWLPLVMIWIFWAVNLVGVRTYGITVIVLMVLMLSGGLCLIVTGFTSTPQQFINAWQISEGQDVLAAIQSTETPRPSIGGLFEATATLFFAYIGFASISQAGGEAADPKRSLPRAFILSAIAITGYYLLFSFAIYRAVPWRFVHHISVEREITAPHLMGVLMHPAIAAYVALMAGIALANDIPPLLLAVSRLFYSWARDGIFPEALAAVHRKFRTPHYALTISAMIASLIVYICYLDQSFAAGVDMINIALLTTYILVCVGVITFPYVNPKLYDQVTFLRSRTIQISLAVVGLLADSALLVIQFNAHLQKIPATFFGWLKNPVLLWAVVLIIGVVVFLVMWDIRTKQGWDLQAIFANLPEEDETELDIQEPTI